MNTFTTKFNFHYQRLIALIAMFCLVAFALTSVANAQIQGFTEPFRKVDLSSDESGSIAELYAEEGKGFAKNEVLARLDDRVQQIQLEITTEMSKATSQMEAAEQSYKKRQAIVNQLQQLKDKGHASESEIIRGSMELAIAKAKYLSAVEEKAIQQLEVRRAQLQLERRSIRAPFTGVVSRIHRREGEFLSPVRPEIVTFIQSDRLLATFAIPSSEIYQLEIGKSFDVHIAGGSVVTGTVYSIGVETDAQSGTVLVKLVIENPTLELRAGESCSLTLG